MASYNFSSFHLDTLREIGNIGAGHAATSLSKLLGKKIVMEVPEARIVTLSEVTDMVGGPEQLVAAVFLRIEGDVHGSMFVIISVEEAHLIIHYLMDNQDLTMEDEIGYSALQEIGNILAGSYLSSLSDFTGLILQPTPPALTIDMAGAILASGLTEISRFGEHAILIETSFNEWNEMRGHFLLLPDPDAFPTIFRALGVPGDE